MTSTITGKARTQPGVDVNHVHLLAEMGPFIDRVFRDIQQARQRVFVECFIIAPDRLGEGLLTRLESAAQRGVEVRLLYDPSGSSHLTFERLDRLRAHGVAVRAYGIGAWMGVFRPGIRDHARLVLVDGTAYTGGHAWDDRWLPAARGGQGWSDLNCSLMGPLAAQDWANLFDCRWREAYKLWPATLDTAGKYPDARLLSDGPGWRRSIAEAYIDAFARATRRISIGNAYFFPTRKFKRALFQAARRGVEVKVIVPGFSDLMVIRRAARAEYRSWLRRGIQIFEYQGAMLHSKYGLVDEQWATVGSFNVIGSSLRLTVETNLAVRDATFIRAVAAQFDADLQRSCQIDAKTLDQRPVTSRVLDALAQGLLLALNRVLHALG